MTSLPKSPSGTLGLDEVLDGGFPRGRPVLVAGGPGCGKTLLGMQFLVRGAQDYGEPGVFVAFEERPEDLRANVQSLGFDLTDLESRDLLSLDHIQVDPGQIVESGEYDLSGLFIRLEHAIDSIGAKRVVIDTLEMLFGGLTNYGVLRAELRRLFDWLKTKGVTALITAERGHSELTRHGLEEYVSDCVLALENRVCEGISTRRLRVVKYRGSHHGTNEYPFLIDRSGIIVSPLTSARLEHSASEERISTGVAALDDMLGGQGVYRGSTVLVSGTAGAGKSSLAGHFVAATAARGERSLYFAFEESEQQITRNMRSIGLDMKSLVDGGHLRFVSARPTAYGIESHLAVIHKHIREFAPHSVVLDPASNFLASGTRQDAHSMIVRLIDFLKKQGINMLLTDLTDGGSHIEGTHLDFSSIVDTWILVRSLESNGERNRGLYVLKSRGMAHSHQVREFKITDHGVQLLEVYVGEAGVLTGTARLAQEAREAAEETKRQATLLAKKRAVERLEALRRERLTALEADYESQKTDLLESITELEADARELERRRHAMARARK